jgi:hypothetical protein
MISSCSTLNRVFFLSYIPFYGIFTPVKTLRGTACQQVFFSFPSALGCFFFYITPLKLSITAVLCTVIGFIFARIMENFIKNKLPHGVHGGTVGPFLAHR